MLPDRVSNPGPLTYESGAIFVCPFKNISHIEPIIFLYKQLLDKTCSENLTETRKLQLSLPDVGFCFLNFGLSGD